MRAWPAWERIAETLWPTTAIPGAPYGLLRMRVKLHDGAPFTFSDGATIVKGARICELHCDNQRFVKLVVGGGINPYRAGRADLASLAALVEAGALEVTAIFGRSILAVGGKRLGFTSRDLPITSWLRLERFFMIGLLLIYTESGLNHLTRGRTVWSYPKELWMSREQLLKRYGQARRARSPDGGIQAPPIST